MNALRVTLFKDRGAKQRFPHDLDGAALAARILTTRAPSKDRLPWLKLADFGDTATKKGSLRHDKNVTRLTGVEADYDAEQVTFDAAEAALRSVGVMVILYTSPSATATTHRWRILAPFSAPIEANPERLRSIRRFYLDKLSEAVRAKFSTESYTLSQAYYYGAVGDNPAHCVVRIPGRAVDEIWTYDATQVAEPTKLNGAGLANTVEQFLTGEEAHPRLASMTQYLANHGLDADSIKALARPLIRQLPRDPRRLATLAGEELDRAVGSAVAKATHRRAASEFSAVASGTHVGLRQIADIVAERRTTRWLVRDVLEAGVLAVVAGAPGSYKSLWLLDTAMRAALDGHAIVLLSAEGSGLGRRVEAWMVRYGADRDLGTLPIYVVEMALNLASGPDLSSVTAAVDALGVRPDLIGIDTLSKYTPGLDENDNSEMAAFLFRVGVALRDTYKSTVAVVAHTGHGDASRPRGASSLVANTDAAYIVSFKKDMQLVTVSRDRFKDSPTLPALLYTPEVVVLDWQDNDNNPVTSVVLKESVMHATQPTGPEPAGDTAAGQLLAELRRRQDAAAGALTWNEAALRAIAREVCLSRAGNPASKATARSAVERAVQVLSRRWNGYQMPDADGLELLG